MIGIICALDAERDAVVSKLNDIRVEEYKSFVFHIGKIKNQEILVTTTRAGKVNASICTSIIILEYNCDLIINTGIAGGLNSEENSLDVVIGTKLTYHDFDVCTIDNIKKGFGNNPPIEFNTDDKISRMIVETCQEKGIRCFYKPIVTGDQFVADQPLVKQIITDFPEAYACDMESAAVCHTAYKLNIPCCIIRTLSDIAVKEGDYIGYYDIKNKACMVAGEVLFNFLKRYTNG